jgi:hypothetical protein
VIAAVIVVVVVLGGALAVGTGALPGVSNTAFPGNLSVDGEIQIKASGENATATGSVPLANEPPTIASAVATDGTDDDGIVQDDDTIELSAAVADAETGVDSVTANASTFGVETVRLEDADGDGTYTGSFTVNASAVAGDGSRATRITATDTEGLTSEASTNTLELALPTPCETNVSTTGRLGEEVFEMAGPLGFCNVIGGNEANGSLRVFVADGLIATDRYSDDTWTRQYFTYSGSVLVLDGEKIGLGYYNQADDPASSFSGDLPRYESPDDQFLSANDTTVTTVWRFEGVELKQHVTLPTEDAQFYGLRWEITNRGGSTVRNATFLRGADTFLGGNDFGKGFWDAGTNTVGVTDTNDGVQQRLSFQGVTDPDGYRSAFWSDVVADVESGDLENSVDTTDHDNGYALEWRRDAIEPGSSWRVRAFESFVRSSLSVSGSGVKTLDGSSEQFAFNVSALGDRNLTVDYNATCPEPINCTTPANETIEGGSTSQVNVTAEVVGDLDQRLYEVVLTADAEGVQPVQGASLLEVPGPFFEVTSVTGPASTEPGAPTTVTAEITNTGEEPGQRAISFALGDERRERFVNLSASESRTVAFTVPAPSDQGTYDATVRTGDDSETTGVEVVGRQFVCGQSTGDPHIVTFDGLSYDYMTAEDTVLLDGETTAGRPLVVTARQVPVAGSDSVTVNNATATAVGDDIVTIRAGAEQPLRINGDPVALASGDAVSVGPGGEVRKQGSTYTVFYPGPDNETTAADERLTVHVVGDRVDIEACLYADRDAPVEGLLGTVDDSPDITFRNGTALEQPLDTDVLYGAFRADWAATGEENLFSTRYEVANFPRDRATVEDLSAEQRERAEDVLADTCLEPRTPQYRDALIDVALTGDSSYVASACRVNRGTVTEATGANFGPMASFTRTPVAPQVGDTVTFNATNSTDGDGSIVSYRWDLDGDGAFDDATGVEVTTSYGAPGEVVVSLRVEDDDGAGGTVETNVTVLAGPNTPPSASFSVRPAEPVVGETMTFNATNSTDANGPITAYRWDLDGDGAFDDATGPVVTASYSTAQNVTVALEVEGDAGVTNTTETTVVVSEQSDTIAPGQPGFGTVVAAIALVVIVLFARRRD